MIKLFIRNKIVDIVNYLYDNGSSIIVIPAILTIFYLVGYVAYAIPYVPTHMVNDLALINDAFTFNAVVSQIILGSLTIFIPAGVCGLIILAYYMVTKSIKWIKSNYALAKNGVKVKVRWKKG